MHAELDRQLERLGTDGHRAVVAGTLRGGAPVVRGWAAAGPPPDGAARFEIGSITKAFTGVLLADMVLRGEVGLEDPLSRHLPAPRPAWRHREPTLLELATHRSGLPNTPGGMARAEATYALGFGRTDPWAGRTAEDYARLVAAERPKRAPGGRMRYSTVGVGLLGDALAARAGMPYDDLLRARVLAPLGLDATGITAAPGRVVQGHSRRGRPRPAFQDHMAPAGSLRSSADDMLRFLAACLEPPPHAPGPALALARQPHVRVSRRVRMGLCWILLARRRRPVAVWHNGGTWGFRSFAGFAPGRGAAAVVLSNTARGVDRAGFALLDAQA